MSFCPVIKSLIRNIVSELTIKDLNALSSFGFQIGLVFFFYPFSAMNCQRLWKKIVLRAKQMTGKFWSKLNCNGQKRSNCYKLLLRELIEIESKKSAIDNFKITQRAGINTN